jgi:hypothetical protein
MPHIKYHLSKRAMSNNYELQNNISVRFRYCSCPLIFVKTAIIFVQTPAMTFFKLLLPATAGRRATLYPLRATLAAALAATALLTSCRPPEKPVTQQEALDYAKKMETSVTQHNQSVLDSVIDEKYFAARVLLEAHQLFNPDLSKKAKAEIANLRLGLKILSTTEQMGSFQLLRQYVKDGHQHLLFRYFTDNADLNYYDFELANGNQGVKADDVFIYSSGEQLSKTFTVPLLESGKSSDMSDSDKANAHLISQAEEYLKGGNPDEAYSFYDQLPDKVKKEQKVQKLHIRIGQKIGDSAFVAALKEYKSNCPDDPFIYLTILRTGEKMSNYADALDALNHLETFLPSDPFLDFYRGVLYDRLNKPQESTLALERFHARWPSFGPGIAELLNNHMVAGHIDSAAMLITEAEKLKNITPEQVEAIKKAYPPMRAYLK